MALDQTLRHQRTVSTVAGSPPFENKDYSNEAGQQWQEEADMSHIYITWRRDIRPAAKQGW